jgi:hypothetical protein
MDFSGQAGSGVGFGWKHITESRLKNQIIESKPLGDARRDHGDSFIRPSRGTKVKRLYTENMLLALLFFLATLASAQDMDSAARELARKIATASGRQDVALTVRNMSSLSEAAVARVNTVLENELGLRSPRPGSERVAVNVTLSENVQSYLWVALVQQDVVMLSVPRTSEPAAASARVTIQKKLLWEQDKPILDAGISESLLIVLDPDSVSFYRERQLAQSLPVQSTRPMPRDPRGRLIIDRDSFRAFLPGAICSGSIRPAPAITCAEWAGAWPLDGGSGAELVAGRNYFTEPRLPAFFSTATITGRRLVTGVDGRAHIYDGTLREAGQVSGWGSDIAAVDSGCGGERQIMATRPGEGSESDSIQLYDVTAGRSGVAVSDPATFPGPVVALWPSDRTGEAVAIAQSVKTGRYAAYSLAITCNR